jgi:TolB-like protein
MRAGKIILLVFGALALVPASLSAQPKPLIAVLDLDVAGGTKEQALALSNQLRTEILKTGRFTVVDRSQIDDILKEQAFQQAGCTSQECAVEVGRILGIRQIVTGSVTRVADDLWQVTAQVTDVETAETLQAESLNHQGRYPDLLLNGMKNLAALLAKQAPREPVAKPAPPKPAEPADPVTGWRFKWISSLTLGLAAAYYGYSESQATADSNDKQKSIIDQMNSGSLSTSEYNALDDDLKSEEDAAKQHQENSNIGYGVAAVLIGLTAWIYFDPPEAAPAKTSWMPLILPEPNGVRLALAVRW